MAAHARLKNEFMEDEKCHNLMSWLNYFLYYLVQSEIHDKNVTIVEQVLVFWDFVDITTVQPLFCPSQSNWNTGI